MIYLLSAQDGTQSESVSSGLTSILLRFLPLDLQTMAGQENWQKLHAFIRTAAHFTEYAILGVLLSSFLLRFSRYRAVLFSMVAGMIYAATDEWHQAFVPGRACQFSDWMVDALGCLFGILLVLFFVRVAIFFKKICTSRRKGT